MCLHFWTHHHAAPALNFWIESTSVCLWARDPSALIGISQFVNIELLSAPDWFADSSLQAVHYHLTNLSWRKIYFTAALFHVVVVWYPIALYALFHATWNWVPGILKNGGLDTFLTISVHIASMATTTHVLMFRNCMKRFENLVDNYRTAFPCQALLGKKEVSARPNLFLGFYVSSRPRFNRMVRNLIKHCLYPP